jgi:putative hydrolase of the HAD superfamily
VVSRKTPETYAAILSRHRIDPARFLMIGNSVRSDIMPVIEVGGWAAHVPAALTWSHEHAEVPASAMDRCFELAALDRVPALIEELERTM